MKRMFDSKRRRYLAGVGVFLLVAALFAGMAGCSGGGSPLPPSKNLEIRTWYDLDAIRDNLAGNHTLMNDLDSTILGYEELASRTANQGRGWDPIGDAHPFIGSLDGQGHKIGNLCIDRPGGRDCVGLFGVVGEGGLIENVSVISADVTGNLEADYHGSDCAGSLVGVNAGTVNNSSSAGSVTCGWYAGGLVGMNSGTVSNSYYIGSVTSNMSGGGLVGSNHGDVMNSYYDRAEVIINGEHIITIGALSSQDFEEWLAHDSFLDINERLTEEDGYYIINNITDFKQLLAFGQNASLKFRLQNDLDLAAELDFHIPYLAGELTGNYHEISNFRFDSSALYSAALFGYVASGAKVTNLGVEHVNITGDNLVGGLVGVNCGTVSNCYAMGNVTRAESSEAPGNATGGLVARSTGTVSNSHFSGTVSGDHHVGALVGDNSGTFAVDGGTVSDSYSAGSVAGNWGVGGLVGSNRKGTVTGSCSSASVTAGCCLVGGLVGDGDGTVSNSYSTGEVTGGHAAGGLVGGTGGYVSNSYSTGSVTGSSSGGLVGSSDEDTVSNSFWDTQTSGQATSDGGTGRNTTEMQDIATFSNAGWDIVAVANPSTRNSAYIWNIVDDVTYPFLSWQAF